MTGIDLAPTSPAPSRPARPARGAAIELSVVLPTFNERGNLREVLDRIEAALDGIAFEVVVVDDDSPDGTHALAREIGRLDRRVRCIRRVGRRGLASACIEGMLASVGRHVAVMDADLQHDPALLPRMLEVLCAGEAEVVVASRYVEGGAVPGWSRRRLWLSRLAAGLGRRLLRQPLADPMSGYFMLHQGVIERALPRLSGLGFKVLLDLLVSLPEPPRVVELPLRFRQRQSGESKLDGQVMLDYLLLLADKTLGRRVPVRFLAFALVGTTGLFVHLLVVALLHDGLGLGFVHAHVAATLVAMTSNFTLNNVLTYRDRRLVGRAWLRGWLSFVLVCSIGAIANVGVAAWLFVPGEIWLLPALAGILVGVVWNYAVTAVYTWRDPARG